jgi:hypothetical protein
MGMEYKEELETAVPSVQPLYHIFSSQHRHPDQSNGNILIFRPLHLPVEARVALSLAHHVSQDVTVEDRLSSIACSTGLRLSSAQGPNADYTSRAAQTLSLPRQRGRL